MRIAIVGAGLQARRRAAVIAASTDTEMVVVAATHMTSAARLAQEVRAEASTDWAAAVVRPDVDAVIVCTPPDLHEEIASVALGAGKHVLCEKPLARSSAEAQRMVDQADADGRILWCGFNHRYHPALRQVRQWLAQGDLGEAMYLRARYGIGGRPGYEREWRADPEQSGGGELLDQGIHALDLFRWFLGDFTEVSAVLQQAFWPALVEDNAFCLLRTEAGQVASLHASWTQWKNLFAFEVFGEHGYLIVEGLGGSYGPERLVAGERPASFGAPREECFEFDGGDASWVAEWEEFAAAIREDRAPLADGWDGLQALRLAEAAYASAHARRAIHVAQGESHAQRRVHLELSRGRSASGRDD